MGDSHYRLKKIMKILAKYYMIIGERSNGKTYAVLELGVERYFKTGKQMAYIRRWHDDFTGKRGQSLFNNLVENNVIQKMSKGRFNHVKYKSAAWYFCRLEKNDIVEMEETPFAYAFSLSSSEHDKSTSFPNITTILFDEFITRNFYLPDEFVIFMNVLSTIIRDRDDVDIFMCGNTINKYCIYFQEMGLKHIPDMKAGDIDTYNYGVSGLTVAVEYTLPSIKGKRSDVYFAFDNPKLNMITGGSWEIDIYPHCPYKYLPKNVKFSYFIEFGGNLLQANIVYIDSLNYFTFIHTKTTPIKESNEIVYSTDIKMGHNYKRILTRPRTKVEKVIYEFFLREKVFYSNNEVGEVVRNYLKWCRKNAAN